MSRAKEVGFIDGKELRKARTDEKQIGCFKVNFLVKVKEERTYVCH